MAAVWAGRYCSPALKGWFRLVRTDAGGFGKWFRTLLLALLILAMTGMIYATGESIRTARELGQKALEASALAVSSSVERAFRSGKTKEEVRAILAERLVAYALVADRDGNVLFHANPELEGGKLVEAEGGGLMIEEPSGKMGALGLGTPAFIYDYPLRIEKEEPVTLRVALHLGTMETIDAQARRLWAVVGAMLALLVASFFALDRLFSKVTNLQREIARRERLSLIGRMTATLAHEIRNAVYAVKGYSQWLGEKVGDQSPVRSDVEAILAGTGRIEGIVDNLLNFARDETFTPARISVAEAAAKAVAEGAMNWGGTILSEVDSRLFASADEGALHGALVNAVRNSLQAMGNEGVLKLSAGARKGRVWMAVEDTGGGLSAEALEKAFTPFFTTKTDGTGLGLAYSRKVVEAMGGEITIGNFGAGAKLTIWLPEAEEGKGG